MARFLNQGRVGQDTDSWPVGEACCGDWKKWGVADYDTEGAMVGAEPV